MFDETQIKIIDATMTIIVEKGVFGNYDQKHSQTRRSK